MFKTVLTKLKTCFFRSTAEVEPENSEELETLFKQRYHAFKLLLAANNKALESMTELDLALRGNTPFGMSFTRSRCTALCATVFSLIRNLEALAPQKYSSLKPAFTKIQQQINAIIEPPAKPLSIQPLLSLNEIDKNHADQVGNKLANLGELKNHLGLSVPQGFVLTTKAYSLFMEYNDLKAEIRRILSLRATPQPLSATREKTPLLDEEEQNVFAFSSQIQKKIIQATLPQEIKNQINEQLAEIFSNHDFPPRLALRSSALGEDDPGTSFAGQYHSELNVEREEIEQAYKEVVASKYSVQALSYRLRKGIKDEDVPMCVGCIEMIDAVAGGVVYTKDPTNPLADTLIVSADWGLGKSVVDGSSDPDMFTLSRKDELQVLRHTPGNREKKLVCDREKGLRWQELDEREKTTPPLNPSQLGELAAICLRIENHYGLPQDIEWALSQEKKIVIVQTRSLRLMPQIRDKHSSQTEGGILCGGMTASPGATSGKVFIVQKDVDLLLFPENSILVSSKSIPKWASVLSKAAGMITEHGSVAGHLANVAREFQVPAVFGLRGALAELRNGQEITLDADNCVVYAGKIPQLIQGRKKTGFMHGTPVHDNLKTVCEHILPLHLLDPDGLDFKPENCATLHDITRFCHEKSVQEMFAFGKNHNFASKSSKQLKTHIAMQWWLIDLDDGFTHRIEGPYVRLNEITSIPMLAIWKGATAIAWEGPPAMDSKGMMSVFFQATVNPHLNMATASDYTNRNYFMVSKNFCNLQSRFGFHFMTIEALVGERVRENYIRFQFKGGAADSQRRIRRAQFVGEILEQHDFITKIRGDALMARMDNYPQEELVKKLWILGHLLIHTRQLDMIMSREELVTHYKQKILAQIETIFQQDEQANKKSNIGCRAVSPRE